MGFHALPSLPGRCNLRRQAESKTAVGSTAAAASGTTTSLGMYDLTTSYQTIYEKAGSGAYSTNFYRIQAQAPNSSSIRFLITFGDSHTGRGYFDSVDGTLSSVAGNFRPNSGTLPNGFDVTFAQNIYDIISHNEILLQK